MNVPKSSRPPYIPVNITILIIGPSPRKGTLLFGNLHTPGLEGGVTAFLGSYWFMFWVLPPLSNSWIRIIIWLYIALNRTPNVDCYCGGQYPIYVALDEGHGQLHLEPCSPVNYTVEACKGALCDCCCSLDPKTTKT